MPRAPAVLTALAAAALVCSGVVAWAQDFSRTLDRVSLVETGQGPALRLTFSQPVEAEPIAQHEPGGFRLRFSATGSNVPRSIFKVQEESLVRDYRVVQNQYATTVEVGLNDAGLNLEGGLSYSRDGNVMHVLLQPERAATAAGRTGAASDADVLAEVERRIAGERARPSAQGAQGGAGGAGGGQPAASAAPEADWWSTLATMLVALVVVLAVFYGLVHLYNRFLGARLGPRGAGYPIRHLGSFHVGPKQRVVVLDINGEVVACGVTPHQISFLTRLGGRNSGQQRRSGGTGPQGSGGRPPAESEQSGAGGRAPAATAAPESKDPVHQFAETLKEKVSSLKRIK